MAGRYDDVLSSSCGVCTLKTDGLCVNRFGLRMKMTEGSVESSDGLKGNTPKRLADATTADLEALHGIGAKAAELIVNAAGSEDNCLETWEQVGLLFFVPFSGSCGFNLFSACGDCTIFVMQDLLIVLVECRSGTSKE